MKMFAVILLLVFVGAAFPAERKSPIETLMYLVDKPDSIASFRQHAKQISIIAPQCFRMDKDGFVKGEVPPEVLNIARENQVAVMPLVVNGVGFDQPLMHAMLDNAEARSRAIRYLLYYALRDGYVGIQFDYENILYTYRDKYTDFVREAAREFHKHSLKLSIAVVGRYSDDRNVESPGGYDN
jgi:spore germination protein YaaH